MTEEGGVPGYAGRRQHRNGDLWGKAEKIMTVPEKLSALRACMKSEGIDAWLVPTDDFHGSEYVGGYFK